jgi:hypothetical protein
MSLYDKASLVQIPSGTKSGTLYSVLPANGDGDFTHTRASSATRVNKDGLIESVASGVPRLDYPLIDGVVQSCPELLLEPLSKNEIADSEDYSSSGSWTNSNSTDSLDSSAVAPDGSAGVYKIAPDTANSNHSVQYSNLVLSGGTVVFSVFAKAGTERYVRLRVGNTTDNPRVWYDLEKGIVEKQDIAGMGSIEDYGNGWYRLIVANTGNTITSTTGVAQIFIQSESSLDKATPQTSYTGDPNQNIYVWGAQWENLGHVSSYIPTSGSTVTRNADVCDGAGTSAEFNDSEGVLFAEARGLNDTDTGNRYISITDGTAANSVMIQFRNNGELRTYNGGTGSSNTMFLEDIDLTETQKIAIKYGNSTSDYRLYLNGFQKTLYSLFSATPVTGLDELRFRYAPSGGSDFYGKTKQLMVFNQALTDSELEQITSWRSFDEMAKGQQYTIE